MGTPTPASIAKKRPTFAIACGLFACLAFAQLMAVGVAIATRVGETREVVRYIKGDPLIVSVPTIRDNFETEDNSKPRSIEELLAAYSNPDEPLNYTPSSPPNTVPTPNTLAETPTISDPAVEKLVNDARRHHLKGDLVKALIKLEEAEARAENEPAVYFSKAQLFEDMGQWEKATDNYEKLFNMGIGIGVYYHKAAYILEHGLEGNRVNKDELLVIGPIFRRVSDDGLSVRLTIPIRSNPDDSFDPTQLEVKVHHYDLVDNKRIEPVPPARADNIQTFWVNDNPTWEAQEEIAESFYTLPPLTQADAHIFGARTYFGYVAELYYENELIDQQAHPRRLHAKHAQRLQAPSFEIPYDFPLDEPLPNINPDNPLLPALPQY